LCLHIEAHAFRLTYYAARNTIAAMIQSFSCKDTQALTDFGPAEVEIVDYH